VKDVFCARQILKVCLALVFALSVEAGADSNELRFAFRNDTHHVIFELSEEYGALFEEYWEKIEKLTPETPRDKVAIVPNCL